MEISESHARELEKQSARKKLLREQLTMQLEGRDSILLEAGCGHGHWLTSYAESHAEEHCVGVDLISWRIRKAEEKRDKRELENLYFYKAELGEFFECLPEHIRLHKTVMLFPDPWPKARHHRRRMVQNEFLDVLAGRTGIGDQFYFRTDDRPYFDWTIEHLENHPKWRIDPEAPWPHETETYFQGLMDEYFSVIAVRVD